MTRLTNDVDSLNELLTSGGLMILSDAVTIAQVEEGKLAKVAARYGGIYTSHIRGEGAEEPKALAEAIEIGEKARLPVHVLHFKMDAKPNWGHMPEQVRILEQARQRGVDITADQYPYIAAMTGLEQCLPPKLL